MGCAGDTEGPPEEDAVGEVQRGRLLSLGWDEQGNGRRLRSTLQSGIGSLARPSRQMPNMAIFLSKTSASLMQDSSTSRGRKRKLWIPSNASYSRLCTRHWKMVRLTIITAACNAHTSCSWNHNSGGQWLTDIGLLWLLYKRL